jgi:hypothetical protein
MEIHTHTHTHAVLLCTRPKGTIFYNKKNFIVPVFFFRDAVGWPRPEDVLQ